MTDQSKAARRDTAFIGHPVGLGWLSGTEFWERFSYYGMATLLVLYMKHSLLQPGHIEHVIGFGPFLHFMQWVLGPLNNQAVASNIGGWYFGIVYLTPLAGGIIAERFIGRTSAVTIGACLMAMGHFLMAFDATFLIALLCLLTGVGFFKGNIASQVGDLYGHDDPRRADAYQIFMIAVQVAVIGSPIVCSYLADRYGWHWGFGAAGVGMLIGLTTYLSGRSKLPPEPLKQTKAGVIVRPPLTAEGWKSIAALVAIVPVLAVAAIGNQEITIGYLTWGEQTFSLTLLGFSMPVEWLVSLDSIVSTVTMVLVIMFWRWWATRRAEPTELSKIIIGVVLSALGVLALAGAAAQFAATGARVSLLWAVAFHVLNDFGFANVLPVSLALYSRAAPKGYAGIMIPVLYLSLFAANVLTGWLAGHLDMKHAVSFWLLHAGLIAGAGAVLLAVRFVAGRTLAPEYQSPTAAAAGAPA